MKTDSQLRAGAGWGARRAVACLALAVALACGPARAQPSIVVSIPPYADLVERIAGPGATVDVLLPAGATPHAYDASPRDLALLNGADLVVVNGGVDAWMLDLVEGSGRDEPPFVVVDALAEEGIEPHVWLDPLLMVQVVPPLAEALAEADPAGAEAYAAAARELVAELRALDEELKALMAPVAGAAFVPFHDAWPHFARRYGLDLVVEIEPFPGREPSARELAAAVDLVRASGARAIFTEVQLADRPARVLAAEAGVAVATLDPLGGVPGRHGYEELLRYNAERIVAALAGGAAGE